MDNFRETIMEQINNKQKLNPMISILQERLTHVVSQFHTPEHPPYAAMIQRALLELNEKGGSTEKSISEFIKRQHDDLPWAHCSFLKHHLGLLSENGEIIVTSGFRYSLCGAGASSVSIKGGKKRRRKKSRWNFEKKRNKRQKLAIVARSQKENEFELIKDPSHLKDQSIPVAGNAVIETEICENDGLQTPKQDGTIGTVLLQFTDEGEDDICSGSKAMDINPPVVVLTDERDNQMGIKQQQLHDPCNLNSTELHAWNNNEDAIQELSSPKRPPGFELLGVDASSGEVSIVNTHPSQLIATVADLLPAPTVSPLPLEKKEQQRNAQKTLVAENLKDDDLPCPLQAIQKKKQEKKKGRQFNKIIKQKEVLLALPLPQKGSPLLEDEPMQDERSQRQLRRWSVNLPVISHTEKVSSSTENSGKCPPVEITSDIEHSHSLKKLPSEYTFITGRKTKASSSSQRQGGAIQRPVSVSPSPSMDLQQDEGRNSQGVCQQDKDMPLRIYQRRRGRRPKSDTDTIVQGELPPAEIQKQQAEELPNLPSCHILQEKTSEAALTKVEFTFPNHKDNSDKDHQLEISKPRGRGRPPKRKRVVNKGKDDQSSEAALTKVEFTFPNHKDNSDKDNQLETSKPRGRGRPPKRKPVVNKEKDDDQSSPRKYQQRAPMPLRGSRQSPRNHQQHASMPLRGSRQSPRNMRKKSYHLRSQKIRKK